MHRILTEGAGAQHHRDRSKGGSVDLWQRVGAERQSCRASSAEVPYAPLELQRGSSQEATRHAEEGVTRLHAFTSFWHVFITSAIVVNIILVWYEIDAGGSMMTGNIARVICVLFLLDLIVNAALGQMHLNLWDAFDTFIVLVNCMDSLIIPCFTAEGLGNFGDVIQALRIVRILRIFKAFRELMDILRAYWYALSKVGWILIFIFVINFFFSCILALTVGAWEDRWQGESAEHIDEWFGSVTRSLQTMFILLTLARWDEIALVLCEGLPSAVVFPVCILYIMGVSFMATSLITGVISESLVNVKEQDPWYKLQKLENDRQDCESKLIALLTEVDISGDGCIQSSELEAAKQLPVDILSVLEAHEIHTSIDDVQFICQVILEGTHIEAVPIDDLADAMTQLRGPAMASKIWEMRLAMRRNDKRLRGRLDDLDKKLDALDTKFDSGMREVKEMLMGRA